MKHFCVNGRRMNMQKKSVVFVTTIFTITCCLSVAFAGRLATPVGTTSGGSLGRATCSGYMEYVNSSSAGADKTTASTSTGAKGTVKASATIHYTDSEGNKTKTSTDNRTEATYAQASATAPSGTHGYKSSSSHYYSSESYGSWSNSLSHDF